MPIIDLQITFRMFKNVLWAYSIGALISSAVSQLRTTIRFSILFFILKISIV